MARLSFAVIFAVLAVAISVSLYFRAPLASQDNFNYNSLPPWPIFKLIMAMKSSLEYFGRSMTPPAFQIMDIGFGLNKAMALYFCGMAGWPQLLHSGIKSGAELSRYANVSKRMTRRLMRACVALDMFWELTASQEEVDDDDRLYANRPIGDNMRSDHPHSMKFIIGHFIEVSSPGLLKLWDVARNDEMYPFSVAFNLPHESTAYWNYLGDHPEKQDQFNRAMTNVDALGTKALVEDYEWGKNCAVIVDVGCGRGSLAAQILRRHPSLRAVLFDMPSVIDEALTFWTSHYQDVMPRATFKPGDFLATGGVPGWMLDSASPACFISKQILHGWDDDGAASIVRNVAAAMQPGDRFLVLEFVQLFPDSSLPRRVFDLTIRTVGGRERTAREIHVLGSGAGLKPGRVYPTRSMYSIVEMVK